MFNHKGMKDTKKCKKNSVLQAAVDTDTPPVGFSPPKVSGSHRPENFTSFK